jgi:hypothetical protein
LLASLAIVFLAMHRWRWGRRESPERQPTSRSGQDEWSVPLPLLGRADHVID